VRRAEEIDGYLLEAFDLFSAQVQASSGGAVPHKTLPRSLQ